MNDLDVRAQAIVDAARDADDPSPSDRDRIKHAILVQVAAGAVASTAVAGSVGMSFAMKVGLAVLAVSLVGGGTAGLMSWRRSDPAANSAVHVPVRPAITREMSLPSVEIPAIAPPAVPAQTESKARRPDKSRKAVEPSGQLVQEDQLNAEVAVLKRAREELRLGRPAQALEALLEYDRRFGKGALGEERQAIAAIAACQAHPGPSARAEAQAFMRLSPHSPLLDRVRAACITPARAISP